MDKLDRLLHEKMKIELAISREQLRLQQGGLTAAKASIKERDQTITDLRDVLASVRKEFADMSAAKLALSQSLESLRAYVVLNLKEAPLEHIIPGRFSREDFITYCRAKNKPEAVKILLRSVHLSLAQAKDLVENRFIPWVDQMFQHLPKPLLPHDVVRFVSPTVSKASDPSSEPIT